MAENPGDIPKVLSALGVTVGNALSFIVQLQTRFARVQEISDREAEVGLLLWLFYICFQYVYSAGLILLTLAGLVALTGGIMNIMGVSWAPEHLTFFYENYSISLILMTGLLVLIMWVNGLSWIPIVLLRWIPGRWPLKQSISWHNLLEFSRLLDQPKPLFLNKAGIDRLADKAITRLM